jgi:hypothetical protein
MKTSHKGLLASLVLALALALASCAKATASLSTELLDEVSGIRVVAENAGEDNVAISQGVIEVKDNDTIVISPDVSKGQFHLAITPGDGGDPIFDEDVDGHVLFTIGSEPGSYDVEVSGREGVTGWMTVFAQSQDELAAQDESLKEELEEAGVDGGELLEEDGGQK